MPEMKKPVQTMRVDYVCDVCNTGVMTATGMVLTSYPPQYEHTCSHCGAVGRLRNQYPTVRYEEVPAEQDLVCDNIILSFGSDEHFSLKKVRFQPHQPDVKPAEPETKSLGILDWVKTLWKKDQS